MKKLLLLITSLSLMLALSMSASAQNKSVKINVVDEIGPVAGASVIVKGTTNGQATDLDGNATINNVDAQSVLVVSSIGYVTEEVTVGNRAQLNVTLKVDSEQIEETVVVGYGTQKKESLTSAITSVRAEDVTKTKTSDVVTSLQGKVPGLLIRQGGGSAGSFTNAISLRGYGTPIIVVDGVVRSDAYSNSNKGAATDLTLAQLNPEDIESISVLKDASASIYGMGAGNGVIMITTKKGTSVKKPYVTYSDIFTIGNPKLPKEVGLVDYLKMTNEMYDNANFPRPYTDEFISQYENGSKEGYSWWDNALHKFSTTQTHNLSVRGGSDDFTYFISGSYNHENSLYKADDNYKYNRYTLRGNFTLKLTKDLSLEYQTSFRATQNVDPYNTDQHSDASHMVFNYIAYEDRLTPAVVDGTTNHYTYAGLAPSYNPMALMDHDLSYTDKRGRQFTNQFILSYNAPFLKGLKLSLQGAYDFNYDATYNKQTVYDLYNYETGEVAGQGGAKNAYSESIRERERYYTRFQANYNWKKGNHSVGALVAAEATILNNRNISAGREFGDFFTHDTISSGLAATATATGTRTNTATAGYLGRINYEYASKYLVEVMARYDGTYIYQKGSRWGFFPSYSLGWRVSEEPFIKNNAPWISNLKLRWSDGKTGLTQGSAYAYQMGYTSNSSYVFTPGSTVKGYRNNEIANTVLSWADIRMTDFGIDWSFWHDMFGGTFDIFQRKRTGIAGTSSGSCPTILGVSVPQINVDSALDFGAELTLTHRNKIGDFNYNVALTGTIARSKNLHVEKQATSTWYSQKNQWSSMTQDRYTTYHALWYFGGTNTQFTGWDDINSSDVRYDAVKGMQSTVPGQYKIEDYDGNGYITYDDVQYKWGETNAPVQFGLNAGFEWKNLDFNMVWQGAVCVSKIIWLLHIFGYGGYNDIYEMYTDRYHVAQYGADPFDPNTEWVSGLWPALVKSTDANTWRPGQYDAPSDFTQMDAKYFRLKSFEFGYTLPKSILSKVGIRSTRVFVGGTNWLTITTKKMKWYDPESAAAMHSSTMPIMRTVNAGINLSF